jgi:hypothetical protein
VLPGNSGTPGDCRIYPRRACSRKIRIMPASADIFCSTLRGNVYEMKHFFHAVALVLI